MKVLLSTLVAIQLAATLCGVGPAAASTLTAPPPGPYRVGFRTVDVTDHSRTVAARTDWKGRSRAGDNFRTVRFSIWYPAVAESSRPPMRYGDYAEATGFEVELDGKLLTGLEGYLAHSGYSDADPEKLRLSAVSPTTAYRDAPPHDGLFPVVVYAPSLGYEAFENASLFEHLASHGYFVAASRSAGPETRDMPINLAGLEASVDDLGLALEALHDFGHADLTRIGAAGFSWGGLSAAVFAMRNHNVRAVLALDGSLEHAELPAVEEQAFFQPRRLRGGYLAIVGDRVPKRSLAPDALYTDFLMLRLPELAHWDFASDMILISAAGPVDPASRSVDEAYTFITRQARRLFDAYLKGDESSRKSLLSDASTAASPAVSIESITSRPALPAPPSPAEFAALLRENVASARQVSRQVKANDPEIELVDWIYLQDVILTSSLETRLELLELAREELGVSSAYYNNLGQTWRLLGDTSKALGYFRQALTLNPESGFAMRAIGELETELGSR
jgi:tetratricopeptide (TPR) repeat protein